ncbi:uncharacterized protein At4g14450, chloroplastic-like [Bidens hawaiensis]|uniref:uncharacterized protein At4g14450, chloroplastic-like n=1 Tax=Bidens hawaiensis TaxID=980011 RepID=UPI00404915E5
MADKSKRQPSRLQRRAPASIQVAPASQWNVAIPLLSPLVTSPEVKMSCVNSNNNQEECRRAVSSDNSNKVVVPPPEKAPVVYKKWQHPAAPFYYEPAPAMTVLQSICSGGVDRS